MISTYTNQAGYSFGRRDTRKPSQDDLQSVSNVSTVSINSRTFNGPLYDGNGTQIA